jgi:hypothetical protein
LVAEGVRRVNKGDVVDEREIRGTINQLVEAWVDLDAAQERLAAFTKSNDPPPLPGAFDSFQSFLDFYGSQQDYKDELRNLKGELAACNKAYEQASLGLQEILPVRVPLHYTYEGERQDLEGTECHILNNLLGSGHKEIDISIPSRRLHHRR